MNNKTGYIVQTDFSSAPVIYKIKYKDNDGLVVLGYELVKYRNYRDSDLKDTEKKEFDSDITIYNTLIEAIQECSRDLVDGTSYYNDIVNQFICVQRSLDFFFYSQLLENN